MNVPIPRSANSVRSHPSSVKYGVICLEPERLDAHTTNSVAHSTADAAAASGNRIPRARRMWHGMVTRPGRRGAAGGRTVAGDDRTGGGGQESNRLTQVPHSGQV